MSVKSRQKSKEDNSIALKERVNTYWAEIFVFNILAVLPLYLYWGRDEYTGGLLSPYISLTMHKSHYMWISSIVLFAVLTLITLSFMGLAKSGSIRERLSNMKIPDWAALGYLVFVYMSALLSPMPNYTNGQSNFSFFLNGITERHDGLITITIYVAAYFTVSRLFVRKERDWALFASSACAVSLIGILQFIGWDIFKLYPYGYSDQTVGVYPFNYLDIIFRTTLGNVDIVSPFVCIIIGFFLALYMKSDKKIRFLYLAAVVLTFAMMIMGGADGGKVGVAAVIALLLALNITDKTAISRMFLALSLSCLLTTLNTAALAARDFYNETGEIRNLYWNGFFKDMWLYSALALAALALAVRYIPVWFKGAQWKAAVITLVLIIAVGVAGVEVVGARVENPENIIYQARETLHMRFADEFGSWRGFIWNRAVKAVPDNLLFGTGPDTFDYAFREYQPEAAVVTQTRFDKAHNDYLQILVCNGILALAAFLVLLFSLAGKSLAKVWNNPALMACVAACGAYMVQAFFGISTPMVTPLFFVILGITRGIVYVRGD